MRDTAPRVRWCRRYDPGETGGYDSAFIDFQPEDASSALETREETPFNEVQLEVLHLPR